jgi:hypothetical protein
MISVSVEADISKAVQMLRLLPQEANRAAYRAINKIADEVKRDSAKEISDHTGLTRADVYKRMYVKGASPSRLIASVHALPSSKNVGFYKGAAPRQTKPGVDIKAWGGRTVYDGAFVKGPPRLRTGLKRKVFRRTGPGKDDITDKVWGPSIRKSFERPFVRARQMAIIKRRWPYHFERYLRGELVKLRGASALKGIANVLPNLTGPTFTIDA